MKPKILQTALALLIPIIVALSGVSAAGDGPKAGEIDPKTGKKIKYWVAPMDPQFIRDEPGKSPMGMDLVPVYEEEGAEKEPSSTIRIDPVTVQNMGVRLGSVERRPIGKSIRAFGNITYDETRLYTVNTKFDGWIETLHVDFVGAEVVKGQPLFGIYSPELLAAQQEYLLAFRQYRNGSNGSKTSRENAKRLLDAARTRLLYWDLSQELVKMLEDTGEIQKTLSVRSPAGGVVIKKDAYAGHFVKAGMHQYEIADLSTVWVDVDVYEYELPWVREGMSAEMELAYLPGQRFTGRVLFVYPYLNERTRTGKLRLAFDNPDGLLKPGMWANVYLKSLLDGDRLVIPQEAVIDSGMRKIVFVSLGKGRFAPREVVTGVEGDNYEVQVLDGLSEGERIVVSGQFLLDSESRLREAIQKMLATRQAPGERQAGDGSDLDMDDLAMQPGEDLDMRGMTMDSDEDLDMSGIGMDPVPGREQPESGGDGS